PLPAFSHILDLPASLSSPTRRSSDLRLRSLRRHRLCIGAGPRGAPRTGDCVGARRARRQSVRARRGEWTMSGSDSPGVLLLTTLDRKSTRLNSSHVAISYAVFCLKKK